MMHPIRRKDDDHVSREVWAAEARRGRARTVAISVIASGALGLFIGHGVEVDSYNSQVDRSRTNCQFQQDDLKDRAKYLDEQADQVLGSAARHIPAADFDVPPYSKFADFKRILVAQARQNRIRAQHTRNRIEDCAHVFPKRTLIPYIE